MDAFSAQAKVLIKTTDEAGRKKILDTLRDLCYSLESAQDSAQRIMYLVQHSSAHNPFCSLLTRG
jgi:demethylsterigmatocystin 6-O-methyltransferase